VVVYHLTAVANQEACLCSLIRTNCESSSMPFNGTYNVDKARSERLKAYLSQQPAIVIVRFQARHERTDLVIIILR